MNEASTKSPFFRRRNCPRIFASIFGVSAIYIGSYIVNSRSGGYWLKPERDGKDRFSMGLSMHTAILWQPAYGYCARYNSDFLGALYAPLVTLDRAWIHPTLYVTDDSTFEWVNHKANVTDIHPRFRDEFITTRNK